MVYNKRERILWVFMSSKKRFFCSLFLLSLLIFLGGCEKGQFVVNNVPEREANEMIVFLANKGIRAEKAPTAAGGPGAAATENLWNISVEESRATEAMAILNQNGLPRVRGTTLLKLFAKEGLMTSETEETVRYQAGLAEQIANMIRMIDGVIDAQVQLSIPPPETIPGAEAKEKKVTASVYVKHQGILDNPNSHLITKIKRLVAGSVVGLDINNVTVISDRARFADIVLKEQLEAITPEAKEYVSIWSIVMNKGSAARFRALFFLLVFISLLFLVMIGWLAWKFYPLLKRQGIRELFHPFPIQESKTKEESEAEKTPPKE